MTDHEKHLYKHKEYIQSLTVNDSPLPEDRRRKPYPTMRKLDINAKTWGEFIKKRMDYHKNIVMNHMDLHINKVLF